MHQVHTKLIAGLGDIGGKPYIDILSCFWICFAFFDAGETSSMDNNLWLNDFEFADKMFD